MPCRDYYDDHPEQYFRDVTQPALKKQISFAESALCAALTALQHVDSQVETISPKKGDFYDWLNFKEAGITKKELVTWHKNHQELDVKHRAAEAIEVKKQAALAKLSPEERKILGIK